MNDLKLILSRKNVLKNKYTGKILKRLLYTYDFFHKKSSLQLTKNEFKKLYFLYVKFCAIQKKETKEKLFPLKFFSLLSQKIKKFNKFYDLIDFLVEISRNSYNSNIKINYKKLFKVFKKSILEDILSTNFQQKNIYLFIEKYGNEITYISISAKNDKQFLEYVLSNIEIFQYAISNYLTNWRRNENSELYYTLRETKYSCDGSPEFVKNNKKEFISVLRNFEKQNGAEATLDVLNSYDEISQSEYVKTKIQN